MLNYMSGSVSFWQIGGKKLDTSVPKCLCLIFGAPESAFEFQGLMVGVWGVLPWLFLSLHCTGCESWGSYLTSHKNSGQMTIGLETERGKLRRLKNGAQVRPKNETITPPHSRLWSKLDQRNWAELCESKTWSPRWRSVVRANYLCFYFITTFFVFNCFHILPVTCSVIWTQLHITRFAKLSQS